LLDTYCGIPSEFQALAAQNTAVYEECYASVVETFAKFKRVNIVRGSVPATLEQVTSAKIAYLSIDMNCAEPEIMAGEYFWDKLSVGAI